jgi:hypothetical protein
MSDWTKALAQFRALHHPVIIAADQALARARAAERRVDHLIRMIQPPQADEVAQIEAEISRLQEMKRRLLQGYRAEK